MAKKVYSILFVIAIAFVILFIILSDRILVNKSSAKYETATTAEDIVVRVYCGNATADVKVTQTGSGAVLFLPSNTEYAEVLNLPGIASGKRYTVSEVGDILDNTGLGNIDVMSSGNVFSVFIDSEDSVDTIDSALKRPHNASAKVVDAVGNIIFSGKLEYIAPRGTSSFVPPKKSYEVRFKKKTGLIDDIKEKNGFSLRITLIRP
ncbi:MAG: hypothetical protein K6E19_00075 [Lachnospiraceae bacterium]|nr:hypothetical protein [Lachnospiraceae bacterium]